MEFYGSEVTILTKANIHKPILPEIIGQYLLYYMSIVYGSSANAYIARFSLIICHYSLFYSLGHGVYAVLLRTHEISLHKNNLPGSPDKDTPLTGSCYILL